MSRPARILWVSAVTIHHFLSYYNGIPVRKRSRRRWERVPLTLRGYTSLREATIRDSSVHKFVRRRILADTSIMMIVTNLDRMNEQLCNRQLSKILWHLPHVLAVLVVCSGGSCGRASHVVQFRHRARWFEDPHSPKDPKYP